MLEDAASPPTASPARLRLLGEVALERPGEPAWRFLPERRFRLLAYLGWRGDWVSRDQLAALFWPERAQEAARSNLRKLLLEARGLELADLQTDRAAVRWAVATDVAALRAAQAAGDHETAVSLYGGELLRDLDAADAPAFTEWLERERLALRTAWRASALAALAQRAPAARVTLARRLIDADPLDEDAVVVLLQAQHALGEVAAQADTLRTYATRLIEDLGVEPSARVRAAAAGTGRPAGVERRAAPSAPASPPAPADGFVGRARELDELCALLANPDCRLLTITGPGGIGKSRLAKEAIRRLGDRYPDGVAWIALDDLGDIEPVPMRIAAAFGVKLGPTEAALDAVVRHVRQRQVMVVFDNAEHLSALPAVVHRLLAAAPGLQLLATSRSRLAPTGAELREWLLPLPGLDLPAPQASTDEILKSPAAQLFAAQARQSEPRFDARAHAGAVGAVVTALGGLPLAILLAAAWVRLLPMADVAQEARQSLDLLERIDDGDERPEHRSVRATFECSWRLLVPQEQAALMAFSVFAGSFSRALAREVAAAPLPLLAALVDKSLLQVDAVGRMSLHPLIQQYAAEKLARDPALCDALRDRHAEAIGRLMAPFQPFERADQDAALALMASELPNLLAAWDWAVRRQRWDIVHACASGLSNHFQNRGPVTDGAALFSQALGTIEAAAPPQPRALAAVALGAASLTYWGGDYARVALLARKALAAARAAADRYAVRHSLNILGLALKRLGQLDESVRYQGEALKRARDDRDIGDVAAFAGNLASLKHELGEFAAARAMALEALDGHRANRNRLGEGAMYNQLGLLADSLDAPAEAVSWYRQGLKLAEEQGLARSKVPLLTHEAAAHVELGDASAALRLTDQSLQMIQAGGLQGSEPACRRVRARALLLIGERDRARTELLAGLATGRRIGTALVIDPLLRDCAAWLASGGDFRAALFLVACADRFRASRAPLHRRFRSQREEYVARIAPAVVDGVLTRAARTELLAALDEASERLTATPVPAVRHDPV